MSRRAPGTGTLLAIGWILLALPGQAATELDASPVTPPDGPADTSIETEILYLSGPGPSRRWRFRCSAGRACGYWTTIPVPSNWELEGFGRFDYGYRRDKRPESADYSLGFKVPARWRGRRVELVFEGVMTDAAVAVNGHLAGVHRGGFTPFRFEVTDSLVYGGTNQLAVRVDEASADPSINRAERDADYWVFGGIYRPVYLASHPPVWIRHVAVDARADGRLALRAEVAGATGEVAISAEIAGLDGAPGGGRLRARGAARAAIELAGIIPGVAAWSAEHPVRYSLEVQLARDGVALHHLRRILGFRTVEVRPGAGLFINGRRTLLRGINRHSFWPATGRALKEARNRADAELIRSLNANAVRASHYPPDRAFLDACDRLGLYVIDELPGWKDAYDTAAGRPLVAEMVRRDAHHPSVILWANGNEGGWNPALDADFVEHDLSRRRVIHPDARFGGFDTEHYPSWQALRDRLAAVDEGGWFARHDDGALVMPTEMLHALYDGGGASGLEDFWALIRSSRRAAGGFLWALLDEGVVRVDQGGRLDTAGSDAPDGIVDAWRHPEPSAAAIRRLWSPVWIDSTQPLRSRPGAETVEVDVANRFVETDLSECTFAFRWQRSPAPGTVPVAALHPSAAPWDGVRPGPTAAPGEHGRLRVPASSGPRPDRLELAAFDRAQRPLGAWSLPLERQALRVRAEVTAMRRGTSSAATQVREEAGKLVLRAGEVFATIDRTTGQLVAFGRGTRDLGIAHGPRPLGGRDGAVVAIRARSGPEGAVVEVARAGALRRLRWHLDGRGWLGLGYLLDDSGRASYSGIAFDLDPRRIRTVGLLGHPDPVWANRPSGLPVSLVRMPLAARGLAALADHRAAGYRAGVDWLRLDTDAGALVVALETDGLLLGLGTPRFPVDARTARAEVPDAALSFLHRIAGMGSKFHPPDALAPPAALPAWGWGSWGWGSWGWGSRLASPGLWAGTLLFYLPETESPPTPRGSGARVNVRSHARRAR